MKPILDADITGHVHTMYRCTDCDAISDGYAEKLYECSSCGTIFTRDNSMSGSNHQCPDCGTMGSKLADVACEECEQAEAEEVDAVYCDECDEFIAPFAGAGDGIEVVWAMHVVECHSA